MRELIEQILDQIFRKSKNTYNYSFDEKFGALGY